MMHEETQTIAAILDGADRYEDLVKRYHVGLIIHCDQLVRNRDQAEDIAQEAFIKAYVKLKDYDPDRSRFSTWLYKIATNICIDYLRKQSKVMAVDGIELLAEATMPTHMEDEERVCVRKAVLALMPPEYRQAIESYYWQGKSYQQIANELDKPINTIRTWIRRAKEQLRGELL